MRCDDVHELESALLDRELSARDSRDVETHLASCARCQGRLESMKDLSESLRAGSEYFRAPADLRSRIGAQVRTEPRPAVRAGQAVPGASILAVSSRWSKWAAAVAAPVAAATLAFTVGMHFGGPSAADRLMAEAIGDHTRALSTDHAIDVASSDQHTVKPWFAGKVDFSPPVHDFGADGFALVGGRLDVLDHTRVAVLAYRRRQHEIDVFVWPVDARLAGGAVSQHKARGFNVMRWSDGGMAFCAVSDLAAGELRELVTLIRSAPSG